jgi:hypothetical protein
LKKYNNTLKAKRKPKANRKPKAKRKPQTDTMNHALISEVIFTNDKAFSHIAIKKARMMLCVCKDAKHNKNIQLSFDNEKKITAYCKQLKSITAKKTRSLGEYVSPMYMRIPRSLYSKKVFEIKTMLAKENASVIKGVKNGMIIEQLQNMIEYCEEYNKLGSIVSNLGIDTLGITDFTDIQGEDADICEEDEGYMSVIFNRMDITTIFKYNAYCMNMLFNDKMNEKAIVLYVCSDYYDINWMDYEKVPLIFE